jgi:hypothetical protein
MTNNMKVQSCTLLLGAGTLTLRSSWVVVVDPSWPTGERDLNLISFGMFLQRIYQIHAQQQSLSVLQKKTELVCM